MKGKRYSQEQIIEVLKAGQAGATVEELSRRFGISSPTYYKWKERYGGMGISEAKRLRELEIENERLKRLVANQALDNSVLKEMLSKKS